MDPKIVQLTAKKIIGMSITTSLAKNDTQALWQQFMPRRNEIMQKLSNDYFSIQIYDSSLSYSDIKPQTQFEKWAGIEVRSFEAIPKGFSSHIICDGLYAVFEHEGDFGKFQENINYIYGQWIPNSEYEIAARDHFTIMGAQYKGGNHPESKEEIWVPIT
jgi:AraC family transcriptional regulator